MCRVGHCEDISTLHPREGAVIWQGVVKKYSDYNIILVFEAITLATKKFDPSLDSENRNTTSFETHGLKKKFWYKESSHSAFFVYKFILFRVTTTYILCV